MPLDDGLEGGLQRVGAQFALQPQGRRHVVRGLAGFELVEEPEPLLGVREGDGARAFDPDDGWGVIALFELVHAARQGGDGGAFE